MATALRTLLPILVVPLLVLASCGPDHAVSVVAAASSTARWRFVLNLAPGAYTLHAKPDDPSYRRRAR
jgi:hypothetical protein